MTYQIIAIAIAFAAIVLFLASLRLLLKQNWFMGMLRGVMGVAAISGAVLLALLAQDVMSYRVLDPGKTILTATFHEKDTDLFRVELQEKTDEYQQVEVKGEQWRIYVQILSWQPLFKAMGFKAGYRLKSIKTRNLVDQYDPPSQTGTVLNRSQYDIDIWELLQIYPQWIPAVEAWQASSPFMPMADEAIFDIRLSGNAIVVYPANEAAESALIP